MIVSQPHGFLRLYYCSLFSILFLVFIFIEVSFHVNAILNERVHELKLINGCLIFCAFVQRLEFRNFKMSHTECLLNRFVHLLIAHGGENCV